MRILTAYLTKQLFKLTGACLSVFVAIYMIIDFIENIDDFMEAEAELMGIVSYLVYKIPHVVVQMLPVAVLIGVIILFSRMKRKNEITALKASGMSTFQISLPLLGAGLLLSGGAFLFSELVVPYTSSKSETARNLETEGYTSKRLYGRYHIWYRSEDAIYWIRRFDDQRMVMEGPRFYFFDDAFRLRERIQARQALWTGTGWELKNGVVQRIIEDGGYTLNPFERLALDIKERPEDFLKPVKQPEEMSYWELESFSEKIQAEGYDATPYRVGMQIKLAFPVINFLMVLVGIPIALRLRTGGTPLAVSVGIGTCFLYLVLMGLTRSLGLSGMLPPFLAAWVANLAFFLIGIYLMMQLES